MCTSIRESESPITKSEIARCYVKSKRGGTTNESLLIARKAKNERPLNLAKIWLKKTSEKVQVLLRNRKKKAKKCKKNTKKIDGKKCSSGHGSARATGLVPGQDFCCVKRKDFCNRRLLFMKSVTYCRTRDANRPAGRPPPFPLISKRF